MTGSKRIPFWASLFTLGGVVVLCALGIWQLQRLEWKNAIIAKLDAAYDNPASQELDLKNITPDDFAYGRVQGIFLPRKALLIGPRTRGEKIGYDLITPLQTAQGTLLINMGFTDWDIGSQPIYHLDHKNIWFEGLARTPQWNSFTPENEPQNDIWYKLDSEEIAKAKDLKNVLPFMLIAEQASHNFDAAYPNNERIYPHNNHLQYALFWFAMALALASIYVLRFWKRP